MSTRTKVTFYQKYQHSTNYSALAQTNSNYPFLAYQNSMPNDMNIVGEFIVQNWEDARYWVATVNFLRAAHKMFFGAEDNEYKGNPPPILHMSGYGDHMFDKVPVIVQSFNVELRNDHDYITTKQDRETINTVSSQISSNIPNKYMNSDEKSIEYRKIVDERLHSDD